MLADIFQNINIFQQFLQENPAKSTKTGLKTALTCTSGINVSVAFPYRCDAGRPDAAQWP